MTEDGGEVEVVVVYEYAAQLPDELSLRVGDVIQRVERLEGGWWRGQLAGRHGMFPDNFVKVGNISTTRNILQCMLHIYDMIRKTKAPALCLKYLMVGW